LLPPAVRLGEYTQLMVAFFTTARGGFLIGNPLRKNILRLKVHSTRVMVCNTSRSFPVASSTCLEAVIMLRVGCVCAEKCKMPETLCHPSSIKISQAKKELNNHIIH
jgi:hypothetical protein